MARTPIKVIREKTARLLPERLKDELRAANDLNADEFMDRIRTIIPKGDPENGNLVETLVKRPGERSEMAVLVSIGSRTHRHPLHLEAGHRNKDGTHTPAKPYWNPTKAVMRKRLNARAARALRKVVKEVTRG